MSEYLIQDTTLTGIADAIRGKTGGTDPVAVPDMAALIAAIEAGGEPEINGCKVVTGEYILAEGFETNTKYTIYESDFKISDDSVLVGGLLYVTQPFTNDDAPFFSVSGCGLGTSTTLTISSQVGYNKYVTYGGYSGGFNLHRINNRILAHLTINSNFAVHVGAVYNWLILYRDN